MRKRITLTIVSAIVLLFFAAGNLSAQKTVLFMTDSDADIADIGSVKDQYNLEFLQNQAAESGTFTVTQFWPSNDITTWSQADIDACNAADLIIVGRSIGSGESKEVEKRAVWNSITTPLMHISPYPCRNSRAHWFNSGAAVVPDNPTEPAEVLMPADPIFSGITLGAGNTLPWATGKTNAIQDKWTDTNGEVVVALNDSIPLIVRFNDIDVPFYEGGPDSAKGPRIYFGFGVEGYDGVSPQHAHFPLTRVAKQVYLNEVTRILNIAPQTAVFGHTDYKVLFMSDFEADIADVGHIKDEWHYNFLLNQEFLAVQFWPGSNITTWSQDTLDMCEDADLIIIGRSIGSGEQKEVEKRDVWNSITTPIINISPYPCRNSRAHWFNSGSAVTPDDCFEPAEALIPGDPIFADVTLGAGNTLTWFTGLSNAIQDKWTDTNGEVVMALNDSTPLIVRFNDIDVPFYDGGPDSAKGPRVYFGFGIEDYGNVTDMSAHFPLTRDAKTIYVAEISRILGVTPPTVVMGASEFVITFVRHDERDDTQIEFLKDNGFLVNTVYSGEDITLWPADTIAILNAADVVICGRSQGSKEFNEPKRAVWNSITAPLILNSIHATRTGNGNWFNTTSAMTAAADIPGHTSLTDDPVIVAAGFDSTTWVFAPSNHSFVESLTTGATATSGKIVVSSGDTIPFVVRFDANAEFYTGSVDKPAGPRVYFGFGAEPADNYFPLSQAAQKVYFAEIMNTVGGAITTPLKLYGTNKSMQLIFTEPAPLTPAFSADVKSYDVALTAEQDTLDITAKAGDANTATVTGAGMDIFIAGDTTIYVICQSEIGQKTTYTLNITKGPDAIDQITLGSENVEIYPNPFNNQLTIRTDEDINFIEVISLQGKVVYHMSVSNTEAVLDLSDLNTGIYLVRTKTADKSYINKIVKN